MFSFKNYVLFKESQESDDFDKNILKHLERLPSRAVTQFAIQCAEAVLPIWEKAFPYNEKGTEIEKQRALAPRQAIEIAKMGENKGYGGNYSSGLHVANALDDLIHNHHIEGTFMNVVYAAHDALNASRTQFPQYAAHFASIHAITSGGINEQQVYEIYKKLLKMWRVIYSTPPDDELKLLTKAAQQQPEETTPRYALADKLGEINDLDHPYIQTMIQHLMDPNAKFTSNDWVFKTLLAK